MGRLRDDGDAMLAGEPLRCLFVQCNDVCVPAADDEQGRRPNPAERLASQIGPATVKWTPNLRQQFKCDTVQRNG